MEIRKALLDAASIVEAGWTQHTYWNQNTGCHCVIGAIMAACGVKFEVVEDEESVLADGTTFPNFEIVFPVGVDRDHCSRVDQVAHDVLFARHQRSSLIGWNDMPGRRASEVAELLRAAADVA